MAIKHAVLGLLLERRGYGYDLMQRLEARLGPAWQLNPSTLYAALDQLEEDEMIVGQEPKAGRGGRRAARRVVYDATPRGREAFEAWVGDPALQQEPVRGELQLKVATARPEDVPSLLDVIDHAELVTRMLCEECREQALATETTVDDRQPFAALAHLSAVLRLEGELAWLRQAREALLRTPPRPKGRRGVVLPSAGGC